jgi:hypothetical protein
MKGTWEFVSTDATIWLYDYKNFNSSNQYVEFGNGTPATNKLIFINNAVFEPFISNSDKNWNYCYIKNNLFHMEYLYKSAAKTANKDTLIFSLSTIFFTGWKPCYFVPTHITENPTININNSGNSAFLEPIAIHPSIIVNNRAPWKWPFQINVSGGLYGKIILEALIDTSDGLTFVKNLGAQESGNNIYYRKS